MEARARPVGSRPARRITFAALVAPLIVAVAGAARAQAPLGPPRQHFEARLDYKLPPGLPGCPTARELRMLMLGQLGYDPIVPGSAGLFKLHVTRKGPTLTAELVLDDGKGKRWGEVMQKATDCEDLVLDAALTARIGINFEILGPAPAPVPPAPASCPAPAPRPECAACPPAKQELSRPPIPIGGGAFVAFGRTRSPAPGIELFTAVRWPLVSFELGGRALLPVPVEVRDDHGRTADVRTWLITSSFAPCFHFRMLFLCTPLDLGVRHTRGGEGLSVKVKSPFSAGLGFRAGAEWTFGDRLALRGAAEILGMMTQNVLVVSSKEVWRTSLVAGVLSLGFNVKL